MPLEARRKFARWFDDQRQEWFGETGEFELSEEQAAELLRRKREFLADPAIAEPWEGTAERIRQHLQARRAEKTAAGRR